MRRRPQPQSFADQPTSVDVKVLAPTLALLAVGVAMVFSASIPSVASVSADMFLFLKREIAYVAVGLLAMWGMSRVPMPWLREKAWGILLVTVALLIGLFPFGAEINGSRAWYVVFGQSFQPSEMAKLVLVICAAAYTARFSAGITNWRRALPPLLVVAGVAGLVALEPDMGTATVTVLAMLAFLHIAGLKVRHILASVGVGGLGAVAMFWLHPYQWERIRNFYFPGPGAELGPGYQKIRSLIALGSGGLTGVGYTKGVEKYFYLPAATTDSILPIVGEELGLIATLAVVGLFAVLVWRGMLIAGRAPDRFSGLVAAGVTCLLGVQAIVNMAVATACIPPTGVPLPLVSYGGSSLLFTLIGVGLLLNVSRSVRWREEAGKVV
jgi:cell division protein FtsW